jgi:hypothetical protein
VNILTTVVLGDRVVILLSLHISSACHSRFALEKSHRHHLFVVINIDGRTFNRMGHKGNKITWFPE